jgi:hypothetical protein
MINEITTENGNKLFVVGLDMENRSAEEIARDAVIQVNSIVDALMASGYGTQKKKNNDNGETNECTT